MSATVEQNELFRDFSDEKRKALAEKGHALPDGGFPIETEEDLKNAIRAIGRAKDPKAAKAHIRKRAKALGHEDLVPEEWSADETASLEDASRRVIFGSGDTMFEVSFEAEPRTVTVAGKEFVVGKPIHIFPFGEWKTVDGRTIAFSEQDAKVLVENANSRKNDLAITFDHEKHHSEAGGWMQDFQIRPDGLWATDVKWVKETYDAISAGKYRYISGEAFGLGNGSPSEPFHPRRLLAASLVPKPAIDGLNEVTLSAQSANAGKETNMAKVTGAELRAALHLSADSSDSDVREHLEKALEAQHEDDKEDAVEKEKAKHKGKVNEEKTGTLTIKHERESADAEDDEGDDDDEKKKFSKDEMSGKFCKTSSQEGTKMGVDDTLAAAKAAGEETAKAAVAASLETVKAVAIEEAGKQARATFAVQEKEKAVDATLLSAEKEGKITPAERDGFRKMLLSADEASVKFATETLAKLPVKAPTDRLPEGIFDVTQSATFAGGQGFDLTKMSYREQSEFLTQVARFATHKGIPIDAARVAVLKGENRDFEAQLSFGAGRAADAFAGAGVGEFRASRRQIPMDPDMVEFIKKRVRSGGIPEQLVPADIQQFAALSDFQPAARTTLPMALGYFQAEFIGDELLPVFVGGADEKAAWPEFAFEKFSAVAKAAGILGAPVRTSLNVTWHTVTLDKYPVQIDIDRRVRAASVTLPRGIDTIAMENVKAQVGVTREVAQAALLTTDSNYYDSTYYTTVSPKWSDAGSPASYSGLPITDISNGMAHIRSGVRAWPDLLALSPNAALAMRRNQQIIDTVRYTGTMERPGTMVSDATLAAIFAGLFNVTIVVGSAGYSSLPSGAGPSDVWGNDAFLICTGKGAIEAPRFGMTVTSAGSPRVRAFPNELLGADGSDSIVYTDSWQVVSVSKKAAFRFKSASDSL